MADILWLSPSAADLDGLLPANQGRKTPSGELLPDGDVSESMLSSERSNGNSWVLSVVVVASGTIGYAVIPELVKSIDVWLLVMVGTDIGAWQIDDTGPEHGSMYELLVRGATDVII
ncbi:MAG: hypothetical protein N0E48_26795 [Candidatus Thiodiazotropha endolucinida]|nr:hypothetical protein [Candidatus Thiodiazotropha taylori]MCW4346935.1 hypothetical protein [Candidatus Thiodiazotropha endolucinida]